MDGGNGNMKEKFTREYIEQLIEKENYLAVTAILKEWDEEDNYKHEIAGLLVQAILEEIKEKRGEKDRVIFLRTILIWVFRDYPGLSQIYRNQLREALYTGRPDIASTLKNLGDLATGKRDIKEDLEDLVDNLKQNIEDAQENKKSDDVKETVTNIVELAEEGLKSGLDQVSKFMQNLSNKTEDPPNDR